jgi:hypothetical protein
VLAVVEGGAVVVVVGALEFVVVLDEPQPPVNMSAPIAMARVSRR